MNIITKIYKYLNICSMMVIVALMCSCENVGSNVNGNDNNNNCNCPLPVLTIDGPRAPKVAAVRTRSSYDGKFVSFIENETILCVVDYNTGIKRSIDVSQFKVPLTIFHYINDYRWCPYNNSELLFSASVSYDTSGSAQYVSGQGLYLYNLETGVVTCKSPSQYGVPITRQCVIREWMTQSRNGADSVWVGFEQYQQGLSKYETGIICLQSGNINHQANYQVSPYRVSSSKTGNHMLVMRVDSISGLYAIYIDGNKSAMPANRQIVDATLSTTGKYTALEVMPVYRDKWRGNFSELWILDWENYNRTHDSSKYITVLNLQKLYCRYSFEGMYPCFVSDSTVCITHQQDGGDAAEPYVIKSDGNVLKRLCSIP